MLLLKKMVCLTTVLNNVVYICIVNSTFHLQILTPKENINSMGNKYALYNYVENASIDPKSIGVIGFLTTESKASCIWHKAEYMELWNS